MESIVDKLSDYLFAAIKSGDYNLIFNLVTIIITILLFLYFKSSLEKRDEKEEDKLWDYIIGYSKAITIIERYFDKDIEFVKVKTNLYELIPYINKNTMKKIINISEEDEIITDIHKSLKSEYNMLKDRYKNDVTKLLAYTIQDNITYAMNRSRIKYLFEPIIYTGVTVIALLTTFLFINIFNTLNTFQKIEFFVLIITFILYGFLIVSIFDLILEKRFILNKKNILFSIVLLLSGLFIHIPPYGLGTYIFALYVVFYIIVILNKTIVMKHEDNTVSTVA